MSDSSLCISWLCSFQGRNSIFRQTDSMWCLSTGPSWAEDRHGPGWLPPINLPLLSTWGLYFSIPFRQHLAVTLSVSDWIFSAKILSHVWLLVIDKSARSRIPLDFTYGKCVCQAGSIAHSWLTGIRTLMQYLGRVLGLRYSTVLLFTCLDSHHQFSSSQFHRQVLKFNVWLVHLTFVLVCSSNNVVYVF